MLIEFTDSGNPVYIEPGLITFVRDAGGGRAVAMQDSRSYLVSEPLDTFLGFGLVEATGPSGDRYAINPAAVASVRPDSGGVGIHFASTGTAHFVQVTEYEGISAR